ncbi:hypothetical protein DRE_04896 [Drechslerella stenobrocha 248]|uniref:Essential protein Yae1 N-terminal domain-containing protein n=1 Tax=Drechslerella stenobrocha 248 TaxID=1043628 RepID=W7HRR5_9PEZI|nr:hypothetical protein DRE_04896 [Drechslerella stenobrocha 248]
MPLRVTLADATSHHSAPLNEIAKPARKMPSDEADVDLFDAVLNLEEDYYAIGHREGFAAGRDAGRLEGRALGIEKGFEKYLALGVIRGRTKVWHARSGAATAATSALPAGIEISNPRHAKHISLLRTLVAEPPIRNEEDDVEEVDDRIRRGRAKVKILENTLKEGLNEDDASGNNELRGGTSSGSVTVVGMTGLETEVEDFKAARQR